MSFWCGLLLFPVAGFAAVGGALFTTALTGSGQDYALAVTSDKQGNTYVAGLTYSPDFAVTPGAYQTKFGQTCDAWIAKVGSDGKVIWATYLGGVLDDWATGIALDSAGNVWVAGYTRSPNFPLVNPIQAVYNEGVTDDYDAFVAELDPTGSKLLFSTYLGGEADDGGAGIAIDANDNVYVAVNSNSTLGYPGESVRPIVGGIIITKLTPQGEFAGNYLHTGGNASAIRLDPAGNIYVAGNSTGYPPNLVLVFKVANDLSKTIFESTFGGSDQNSASALAVNGAGEIWVGGSTTSADFPLVDPIQTSTGSRPLWKSTDGGLTWAPLDNLPFARPQQLLADPTTPTTLYAATADRGIFKSVDGGATWASINTGITGSNVLTITMDPVNPQVLYANAAATVYKTLNGGGSWIAIDRPPTGASQILVDAQNTSMVYEISTAIRKSTDGGVTWANLTLPGTGMAAAAAIDPQANGHLFLTTQAFFCMFSCNGTPGFYRSVDGGNTWIAIPNANPGQHLYADGSTTPSTIYDGYDGLGYRSSDGGVTWTALPASPVAGSPNLQRVAIDAKGTLYVSVYGSTLFASSDHGQTWSALGSPIPPWTAGGNGPSVTGIVPAGTTGTLYAVINIVGSAGFLSKLSADGSTLEYSTYLSGHVSLAPYYNFTAEPAAMITQTWVSGLALDARGELIVVGGTRATDFATVNPAQAANAGLADAFAAVLSGDGLQLRYSTYLGGSGDDGGLAAAADGQGNVLIAGQTWSADFPVTGGFQSPYGYGDAFVTKLAVPPLREMVRWHR